MLDADAPAGLIEPPRRARRSESKSCGAALHGRIVLYARTVHVLPGKTSSAIQTLPHRQIGEQFDALFVTVAPDITLGVMNYSYGFCGFIFLAVAVSAYQGYRGFMFQWVTAKEPFATRKVSLLCLSDMLFYAASSAAGFVALYFAYRLSVLLPDPANIAVGTSVLLIFLAVFGLLGVTGQLPYLIQQGKVLPPGLTGGKAQ